MIMSYLKEKRIIGLVVMLTLSLASLASLPSASASDNPHEPQLPSPLCDGVQAPTEVRVSHHFYARGVQIYQWNGVAWSFVAPMATLYASPNYKGQVGLHYAGPTWESNDGSKVVASRVEGCSPDPTAVPWLLLQTVSTQGPGIFACVSHVQRINTAGGLAPATPGSSVGETAEVPYTAEYYTYRATE
jgi:hypothetical protein